MDFSAPSRQSEKLYTRITVKSRNDEDHLRSSMTGRMTPISWRYCQELWISGPRDQAASFRSSLLFRSFCTASMKTTPARTNGSR